MLKDRLSKTSGWHFHIWLFGPETFSGLSRNGPQVTRWEPQTVIWSYWDRPFSFWGEGRGSWSICLCKNFVFHLCLRPEFFLPCSISFWLWCAQTFILVFFSCAGILKMANHSPGPSKIKWSVAWSVSLYWSSVLQRTESDSRLVA